MILLPSLQLIANGAFLVVPLVLTQAQNIVNFWLVYIYLMDIVISYGYKIISAGTTSNLFTATLFNIMSYFFGYKEASGLGAVTTSASFVVELVWILVEGVFVLVSLHVTDKLIKYKTEGEEQLNIINWAFGTLNVLGIFGFIWAIFYLFEAGEYKYDVAYYVFVGVSAGFVLVLSILKNGFISMEPLTFILYILANLAVSEGWLQSNLFEIISVFRLMVFTYGYFCFKLLRFNEDVEVENDRVVYITILIGVIVRLFSLEATGSFMLASFRRFITVASTIAYGWIVFNYDAKDDQNEWELMFNTIEIQSK
jgi:hypothetical protein